MTTYCGVYPGRRCLVAIVVNSEGRPSPAVTAAMTDEARWELLMRLDSTEALDVELVVPAWLVRLDSIAQLATARGMPVWMASTALVDGLRLVACARRPATVAALLARLPLAVSCESTSAGSAPPTGANSRCSERTTAGDAPPTAARLPRSSTWARSFTGWRSAGITRIKHAKKSEMEAVKLRES